MKSRLKFILWSFVLISSAGCASLAGRKAVEGPVEIKMRGQAGVVQRTRYFSSSRVLTFSERQLVRDRTESVDFTIQTSTVQFFPDRQVLTQRVKTVRKDGTVELRDMAFPELNEEIEFELKTTGEVLKAGLYPRTSIFFVPSMPIPKEPVRVGDTWALEHVWHSARDGIPLKLEVVAILKELWTCEQNRTCADIEISGAVGLAIPSPGASVRFDSKLWGRVVFAVDRGDVIWSEMRSREDMQSIGGDRVLVNSCTISEVEREKPFERFKPCEPKEQPIESVPSFL